ncbi:histidine phosphatase family protein [Lactobacillus sp. 3B(2020)]|uniref:histidine phosphatase family protein n=1 Tax=Lactobacillus sp. 3B(2020) TaxID=2695882 RepID=UPI0015DFFE03|nr:histidine phosphatase family protein [Lactobacillus sp. 3B(2020)]QLL69161.1 histidine phosphatase family protein [Lactobacillus sp. 3B(2020)]
MVERILPQLFSGNNDKWECRGMTTFFLIRHGETIANQLGYIQGTMDNKLSSLTLQSKQQIKDYQRLIRELKISYVFTSPLIRARQTSEIICQKSSLPIVSDDRLKEVSYGEWNGKLLSDLKKNYSSYIDDATNDLKPSANRVNNGEPYNHARKRIISFFKEVARVVPQENVLVVTHGWVIKTFVEACVDSKNTLNFNNPSNLSLTKLTLEQGKSHICFYNRQYDVEVIE